MPLHIPGKLTDFSFMAFTVTLSLEAYVLPILLLTSGVDMFYSQLKGWPGKYRFDHVFFAVHDKKLTAISVGTGLCPTKQFRLESQALIQWAIYPKLLCWVKATVQSVLSLGQVKAWGSELNS